MRYLFTLLICSYIAPVTNAQEIVPIDGLAAFKDAGETWKLAGGVSADLAKPNVLYVREGQKILVNRPDEKNKGQDLFTNREFGDMDLELDFLMAKGSNSGIYLHGRYEIQLEDSWTVRSPSSGKNGGIYERWDEQRPAGQKGYEGHPPRLNASRAPGLWQHLKISFQAPRFDGTGKKIQPAKILQVTLNGVLIHEDVELSGPTRGGMGEEKTTGPLRFQGDHGAVAFRNITITDYGSARPESEDAKPYRVYPILVRGVDNPVFRSFMDLPGGTRVIHAVSASSEENVHYTYDMDTGSIIQVWRGDFLDATPMWYSRGDGSSRPAGAVQTFGNPVTTISKLPSAKAPWKQDTTGTGFKPKGYVIDQHDNPAFRYALNGITVTDATDALPTGEGIRRHLTLSAPAKDLYVRLAAGSSIELVEKGLYIVDDNAYYLRIEDAGGAEPVIRNTDGQTELILPIAMELTYTLLF
ncbi:MAG: DUF1080 domain-containing protein [Chryseosolibacter sp.]